MAFGAARLFPVSARIVEGEIYATDADILVHRNIGVGDVRRQGLPLLGVGVFKKDDNI